MTYRNSREQAEEVVAELTTFGAKALAVQRDQTVPHEASTAVEQAADFLGGRIDVLVNSAGVSVTGTVGRQAPELLDRVRNMLSTNVLGPIVTTHAAAPFLSDGGRVVLVGSALSDRLVTAGVAECAASKAAVDQLARGCARDLGPRGITVNVVRPGAVDTDMNPADGPIGAAQVAMTPLGRFGVTGDIAKAVTFLAGEDASFVSGALLTVDGGFSV